MKEIYKNQPKIKSIINNMKELLIKLNACRDAKLWAGDKSWSEIFNTCHRGDWLLWLFYHTKTESEQDFALLTIAKGHCANTVRHLMKDQRSIINAVDAAINYNGDRAVLKTDDDDDDDAYAYAYAYAAADAAAADAYAYAAAYSYAADATRNEAIIANRLLTANIVRQYIPIEKWNITVE